MTSFKKALTFILAQQRAKTAVAVAVKEISLRVGRKNFLTDVYSHPSPAANPIVFLHGMSPLGIRDPRQVVAVRALAAAGFRVICPELPEIKDLKIGAESITAFGNIVEAILADRALCPTGRASLFAPSFSGAICLRAAAMPAIAPHISSVCALGTMAQVRGSMEYLFLSAEADSYARYIVLSNYLPCVKKYRPLTPVFKALAIDNWHASAEKNPLLVGYGKTDFTAKAMRKLTVAQKKMALALQNDQAYRKQVFDELVPYMENELNAYDTSAVARDIAAPTLLMHGSSDNVIPPGESRRLAPHLNRHRLVISPFLGHADTAVSLRQIADIWRLVSGFAYFFRHAIH